MFNKHKILAFIGARSGSKGLKNKNMMDFSGEPLIAWTIKASLNSKHIDRTIVSTDSPKIAALSKQVGADVPFLRPPQFSKDHSPIYEALNHCLEWLESHEKLSYDTLISLQPTSPLRTSSHIDESIERYFNRKKRDDDTLVSVKKLPEKMGWLMKHKDHRTLEFCFDHRVQYKTRQDLPLYYLPNGAIYIASTKAIRQNQTFFTKKTFYYTMSDSDSVDIDTPEDFKQALQLFKLKKSLSGAYIDGEFSSRLKWN